MLFGRDMGVDGVESSSFVNTWLGWVPLLDKDGMDLRS
jgi:hypothetical protein